jgi:GNAT superfamily N-acetyltransferase
MCCEVAIQPAGIFCLPCGFRHDTSRYGKNCRRAKAFLAMCRHDCISTCISFTIWLTLPGRIGQTSRMAFEMEDDNLARMIRLAEDSFNTRDDPEQISVTEETMARLRQIHPATLTEETNEGGPIAWILVIPTTKPIMERFVAGEISERDLLDITPLTGRYQALYLCSALVLPEHRGKGLARSLLRRTIEAIRMEHPIEALFFWRFSIEGENLAEAASRESGLPLQKRKRRP